MAAQGNVFLFLWGAVHIAYSAIMQFDSEVHGAINRAAFVVLRGPVSLGFVHADDNDAGTASLSVCSRKRKKRNCTSIFLLRTSIVKRQE